MYRDFGIATICTTTVGARLMADELTGQSCCVLPSDQTDVENVEFVVEERHAGKPVSDFNVPGKSQVSLIVRAEHGLVPTPQTILEKNDRICAVVQLQYLDEYRKLFQPTLAKVS